MEKGLRKGGIGKKDGRGEEGMKEERKEERKGSSPSLNASSHNSRSARLPMVESICSFITHEAADTYIQQKRTKRKEQRDIVRHIQ